MNANDLDALARTLTGIRSRRAVLPLSLAGLLTTLGFTGMAAGKRKKKRKKRHSAGPAPCVAESAAATCAGRCGTWANNCGLAVACPGCPTGQDCLANGSCATNCASDLECGTCFCGNADIEGQKYCDVDVGICSGRPTSCASTRQCPPGQHCVYCGSAQSDPRCYPLCG
jgi:hypothetical protein